MVNIDTIIVSKANKYGVDENLIKAIIRTESNYNIYAMRREPHIEDTSWGLMQVLLRTAQEVLNKPDLSANDLLKPEINIEAGTKYFKQKLVTYKGNIKHALSAYNAGSVRFKDNKYINQDYVDKTYRNYLLYKSTTLSSVIVPISIMLFLIGYYKLRSP